MRRATEDEQPVDLFQPSQLDLSQRASLFQPPKALFHQPAATQTDRVARLSRGPAVQIAAAVLVVHRYMRGYVQFSQGAHKIFAVITLVGAYRDAPRTTLLLFGQHQQCRIAFGKAVGVRHHRPRNQSVAVLHQRMAQVAQLRLLAIALLVKPRIGIGSRLMRLVGALLTMEVPPIVIVAKSGDELISRMRAQARETVSGTQLGRPTRGKPLISLDSAQF